GLDALVGRAGAIDPAHALREAGGAPRQVVVDDVDGVLEIQAFTQEIGGNQDVGLERGAVTGSALRSWREGAEHFLPRGGFAPEPPPLSRHSRDPVPPEAAHQVMHAGTRLDEHDRLSHAAVQYARERVCLGVLPRGGERAQLPHPVPVPATPVTGCRSSASGAVPTRIDSPAARSGKGSTTGPVPYPACTCSRERDTLKRAAAAVTACRSASPRAARHSDGTPRAVRSWSRRKRRNKWNRSAMRLCTGVAVTRRTREPTTSLA